MQPAYLFLVGTLLALFTPVDASISLSWVTGEYWNVTTAAWFTNGVRLAAVKEAKGRSVLIRFTADCTPQWPSLDGPTSSGWAGLDGIVVIVANDGSSNGNVVHPLDVGCKSHTHIIQQIINTKGTNMLTGVALPSRYEMPGSPNEPYCATWGELPCDKPPQVLDGPGAAPRPLSVVFYSSSKTAELARLLSKSSSEAVMAALAFEAGPWIEILDELTYHIIDYIIIGLTASIIVLNLYLISVGHRISGQASACPTITRVACTLALLFLAASLLPLRSHLARTSLGASACVATAVATAMLIIIWTLALNQYLPLTRRHAYMSIAVLGLVYYIALCIFSYFAAPRFWLSSTSRLDSTVSSSVFAATGGLIHLVHALVFLVFRQSFLKQRRMGAISRKTRNATLRFAYLATAQMCAHIVLALIAWLHFLPAEMRNHPSFTVTVRILYVLTPLFQNTMTLMLLYTPPEDTNLPSMATHPSISINFAADMQRWDRSPCRMSFETTSTRSSTNSNTRLINSSKQEVPRTRKLSKLLPPIMTSQKLPTRQPANDAAGSDDEHVLFDAGLWSAHSLSALISAHSSDIGSPVHHGSGEHSPNRIAPETDQLYQDADYSALGFYNCGTATSSSPSSSTGYPRSTANSSGGDSDFLPATLDAAVAAVAAVAAAMGETPPEASVPVRESCLLPSQILSSTMIFQEYADNAAHGNRPSPSTYFSAPEECSVIPQVETFVGSADDDVSSPFSPGWKSPTAMSPTRGYLHTVAMRDSMVCSQMHSTPPY
ncbi:hypothetical protein THASP1DRAFT_32474 [Thamnocephalis sphaerospora]|uniref:G-protein coupled receptors family 3 profile domain-containing protein n=1 Tax=Thamnocephalis sphaerospora TaxID=78915 RepID=A0A4P9XIZ3_9FUNG|nr:hypothetical protein THASP1DRAFT_32474 [Thamnocephalis sphaerospora]|eukprot:RKP05686.1 hypothetical protein THASP1DRAFT_32474 [Thamnocephalis sphaerospora]